MNAQKQQGIVLLVSLILLLMLTLIAIAASSQASMQLRISSNSEQRSAAFHAAERGLARWTGAYLNRDANLPTNETFGSQQFVIDPASTFDAPCAGFSLGSMNCFDIRASGMTHCVGTECAATRIHRQGGQRREPLTN